MVLKKPLIHWRVNMSGRVWFSGTVVLFFLLISVSVPGYGQTDRLSPDFDGNGVVDFADFLIFAAGFGSRPGDANWNPALDIDRNGETDFSDFLIFAASYGKTVDDLREPIRVNLSDDVQMEFVYIKPGTFMMGSPEDEEGRFKNEGPQHEVTISKGFYLGKFVVTQAQWEAVMSTAPWREQGVLQSSVGGSKFNVNGHEVRDFRQDLGPIPREVYMKDHPDHPAVYISWDDVQAFVQKLNTSAGKELFRLPTDAEWEYACRAGTTTRWSFGDEESQLENYAWYSDNTWRVGKRYAQLVGTKLPNAWGLYDMHGNVGEWVQSQYSYTSSAKVDPMTDTVYGYRGGAFDQSAHNARSAFRHVGGLQTSTNVTRISSYFVGFRLLKVVDIPALSTTTVPLTDRIP